MAIVSAEKFVQAARDNGYAVGGFNTNNLEWTQAILRAAEAKQAPVLIQTSMGAAKYMGGYKLCKVGGEEDGIIGDGELAPIEDAKAMVATGIDFLAAGIGNIHGPYPANWEGLDLDHLKKLTEAVPGFPIVLHGGSGIPDDQIQEAIKLGVAKVNVNTECQIAFANATRKFVAEYEANEAEYDKKKLFDPRKFLKPGFEAITEAVEERIDVFGSANKA